MVCSMQYLWSQLIIKKVYKLTDRFHHDFHLGGFNLMNDVPTTAPLHRILKKKEEKRFFFMDNIKCLNVSRQSVVPCLFMVTWCTFFFLLHKSKSFNKSVHLHVFMCKLQVTCFELV